ncbi:unnamed protein product [Debaryomyces fabryi]|nr:unnamed protein product [Debaryomyces fabryi]
MYPHQGVYYSSYHGPQGYYPPDMAPPATPLDLSYGQSMLPSNLLVNSPYVQQTLNMVPMSPVLPRQYVPPPVNLSHGNLAHHQQQLQQMHSQHQHQNQQHPHFVSQSPYLTPLGSKSNLEQLNLSRTVILKNIDERVTLNELLNSIDFGPIEYCKMYSRPAPERLRDTDNLKTCVISFVNSKISINFHLKYSKNRYNLNKLKEKLRNSKYLKVSLNESHNTSSNGNSNNFNNHLNRQDYIKLKTLNYILEFNATRCLLLKLHSNSFASIDIEEFENDVTNQCSKFGDIEDFKISTNESKSEIKCLVHFTSIDAAIKSYEFYLKKIQADKQNQIDLEGTDKSLETIEFIQASFHKDRCDRTVIDKPSLGSNTNSPMLGKRQVTINHNNIIPEDLNEHNTDTEEDIEVYEEEALLNDQSILENNESIRNSLLSNAKHPQEPSFDQISSKSSSSQNIDQSYISNTSSYMLNTYPSINQSQVRMQMPQVPSNNSASYQYNPDPFNVGNRTIYLGNLHPNTTVEEIANNVRAGGLVESIKYHPDKRVCFITFIDPTIALKFYLNHQVLHQLVIHGYDITVGWAKNHSGALNREISLAVTAGASRNVYIGIKLNKDENNNISNTPKDEKIRLPNESVLRSDFSKFGELEQINFYHNKDCGFLNFINIADAIKLVDSFESKNISKINKIVGDNGEFYDKYKVFKISFAKDRCGNPPKFSFKKKLGKRKKELMKPEEDLEVSKLDHNRDNSNAVHEEMNEEAAMVFGIMSTADSSKETKNSTDNEKPEVIKKPFEQSDISINGGTKKGNEKINKYEKTDKYEKTPTNNEDVKLPDVVNENDDEEDEDDISIIIGSDETTSSTRDELKQLRNNGHKFYDSKVDTSDTFIPLRKSSRNSSNISLNSHNSNYMKYYNHDSKFPPSPYHHHQQQQQLYYMQNAQRPIAGRMKSFGYGGYYPPTNPNPNQYTYTANPSKNPYSTSGSQVMSQYLAKSQHDNLLYAASILSNDVGIDEDKEYHYKSNSRRNSRK